MMKEEAKAGSPIAPVAPVAPECAGVAIAAVATVMAVLALVPAFTFAQGVSEPAKVNVTCPEAECHVAPFFRGNGGFVGQFNENVMEDGEPIAEVSFVVTCGNVTTTAQVQPAADGTVAQLFDDLNGFACHQDGGEIEIHGLMDGAWYWIHDEKNSAVEHLLPKSVLMNDKTPPFDASGGDITMTAGSGGYATLVKDTASGRVGILPHILPVAPAEGQPATPPCGGADNLHKGCLLTGDYALTIKDMQTGVSVADTTIQRGSADMTLEATIEGEGHIIMDAAEVVTGRFTASGPDGTALPHAYGRVLFFNPRVQEWVPQSTDWTDVVRLTVPRATDGAGAILDSVNSDARDPCRVSNQHRDKPSTVVVRVGSSTNTIPGFGPDGPTASYVISCPPPA